MLCSGSPHKCDEPITTLWFDPEFDRLVTGDASGTVRVVNDATGMTDVDHAESSVQSGLVLNDMLRRNDTTTARTHTIVDEDEEDAEEYLEEAV